MRLHRSILVLFLLTVLLQFPVEGTNISPSTTVASTSSTQASDLLNELGDFEVLGSVYDFDSRVRSTIGVDPYPIVYYPYQVKILSPYYASVRAHGIKYMTYGIFAALETNYTEFCNYYGFDPDQFADNITGVNLEGEYFRYQEPDVNGWPTRGFTSRSLWREVILNVTKLAIDAGADMVVYDGGWGSYSGALTGEAGNPGWYCFDDELVSGFNDYLSSKYNATELAEKFNITNIDSFNFRQYLYDKGYRSKTLQESRSSTIDRVRWEFLPEKDRWGYPIYLPENYTMNLWREYENYQLKVLLDFYDQLSTELKAYAQSKGRNFWIAANLKPTLSYHPPEARLSIVPLLAHIDFPFFEVWYDDIGYPERNVAPLFRTIYATSKHFASMTCPTPSFSGYFQSDNPYPEEQVLATAELIATGGWPQTTIGHNITYIRFIQQHPELLPKNQDGEIALVYSLPSAQNYRRRDSGDPSQDYWGYRPFESVFYLLSDMNNATFDIVIFGDNEFYPYTPTLEEISKYKALILPNATCLSDMQVDLLLDYVNQGGVLIGVGKIGIYDEDGFEVETADRLNFANYFNATGGADDPESIEVYDYGNGKIVSLSQDVMNDYVDRHRAIMESGYIWHDPWYSEDEKEATWWADYELYVGEWIDWFASALNQAGVQTGISTDFNPMVMNIRYWDSENNVTLFHFINYLYDNDCNDTAVDQVNANFTFALRPELQGKTLRITYYTPEHPEGLTLGYTVEPDGRIKVTIPYLHIWGILKVEEDKPQPSTYQIGEPTELTGNIILDGHLRIASDLTIRNATLRIQSISGVPIKIEVLNGASLNMVNVTVEPYDGDSRYYIIVDEGASLRIENSTIKGAGLWGPLDFGGIWIESEDTVVLNSRFEDCYQYGLFLMEGNHTYIRNCTFTGNTEGLMAYWTRLIKVVNCTFTGNSIGLYAKHTHHMKVSDCKFHGNVQFEAMVDRSAFAVLEDSEFIGAEWDGLSFWTSIFVEVVNCTSQNNGYGYTFRNTPISTVLNSDASNNAYSGILLRDVNSWSTMPPSALLGYGTVSVTSTDLPRGDYLPSNVVGGWNGRRTLITHNRIQGNGEGISISCSGYFNEEVRILNNTIQANGVGINVNDTSTSTVAGNNFIDNTVQVKASNIDIDFNATDYGNYWSDYTGSGAYQVCDSIYDYHPLTEPNTISDAPDTTPPSVFILNESWMDDEWDPDGSDGINDVLRLTVRLEDDSSFYVNPQYEVGIVNLIYPALAELEDGGSPVCGYDIFPPEVYEQPNNVTIDFVTDFFAYWVPNYLNETTLQQAHADVYASDIYGHWSRNETEPPHITLVKYRSGSLYVEAAVFDQSNVAEVTLHYSTDGKNYQSVPMTYNEETETYEATVQNTDSGTLWFYISATDVYGSYSESPVYTVEVEEEAVVSVSVSASWNEAAEQLIITATAVCSVCGEVTSGSVRYEVYEMPDWIVLDGDMTYNASSARWEATADTTGLPLGDYSVVVYVTDASGHIGEGETGVTLWDTIGPVVSNVQITPNPTNVNPTLTAQATDYNHRSNIMMAEYFIDEIGDSGTGIGLSPVDEEFDETSESVTGTIDISGLDDGVHTVYVHARDESGNWGDFQSQTFTVDRTGPSLFDVQATPNLGKPGDHFTITVNVVDASGIQSVRAYIQCPDEVDIAVIDLYDDGGHNDGEAGDGVYGNTWDSSGADVGVYYVDIEAEDILGNTAELENAASFTIEQGVETSTGTGTAYFEPESGSIEDLTAVDESTLPTEGKPEDVEFPHGLFSFTITGLTPGQTVTVTITLPSDVPVGTQYWKYHTPEGWYQIPMGDDDGDNVITIELTDGGLGDDDGEANGVIVDAGGPAIPSPTATPPPVGGVVTYPAELKALLTYCILALLSAALGILLLKKLYTQKAGIP